MKFYSEILELVKASFGLDTDSTESEVHHALSKAKSRHQLELEIRKTVELEYNDKVKEAEAYVKLYQQKIALLESHNPKIALATKNNLPQRKIWLQSRSNQWAKKMLAGKK